MALVQLLIKGIRSFSPDNQHVIQFYKPLTLIVGQNGAGKTVPNPMRSCCFPNAPHAGRRLHAMGVLFTDDR